MRIEVLGPGCKNCSALEKATNEALSELGMDASVEKVTDYAKIAGYGVMSTPALVVDGEVRTVGGVPSVDEIAGLLTAVAG